MGHVGGDLTSSSGGVTVSVDPWGCTDCESRLGLSSESNGIKILVTEFWNREERCSPVRKDKINQSMVCCCRVSWYLVYMLSLWYSDIRV